MARILDGRFTARIDEPFVVFIIGMWLPLHKDSKAISCQRTPGKIWQAS